MVDTGKKPEYPNIAAAIRKTRQPDQSSPEPAPEINGPKGPEPTRYGDWEKNGRCIDF